MGFDKPDLGFVIHFHKPSSVIHYYQQVGRAARGIKHGYAILLHGEDDNSISEFFIENAFPPRSLVEKIMTMLDEKPRTISDFQESINQKGGLIQKTLELLCYEYPPPVTKHNFHYYRTPTPFSSDFWTRIDRLTRLRYEELDQMKTYASLQSGHIDFLIKALDDPKTAVDYNGMPDLPTGVDPKLVEAVKQFFQDRPVIITPRKKWPSGKILPNLKVKGNISEIYQAKPGKCLCRYASGNPFAQQIYHEKYTSPIPHFSDNIVQACVALFKKWQPNPSPQWVTCVPSLRRPNLVPDFAKRLAQALNLPFYPIIQKTIDRPEQKTMKNTLQQVLNLDGAFQLTQKPHPTPVLLVDDMCDSRWTFTVLAYMLRVAGSGEVFPFALMSTTSQND